MQRTQHQVGPRELDPFGLETMRQAVHQLAHVLCVPGLSHQPVHQRIAVLVGVGERLCRCLLALFVPGVHALAVERDVAANLFGLGERLLVGPDGVLRDPLIDPQAPVGGIALEGAVGAVLAGLHQVHAHVRLGQVVDRRMPRLVQDQRPVAVGDRYAVEAHLHPAGRGLDGDAVAGLFHGGSLDARAAERLRRIARTPRRG
jgi:hypothetical protein